MAIKYYTRFVLIEDNSADDQEYSGIVSVNRPTDNFDTESIQALIAKNFDLPPNSIRLINWARLQ